MKAPPLTVERAFDQFLNKIRSRGLDKEHEQLA